MADEVVTNRSPAVTNARVMRQESRAAATRLRLDLSVSSSNSCMGHVSYLRKARMKITDSALLFKMLILSFEKNCA
jgi:hypothetical protein